MADNEIKFPLENTEELNDMLTSLEDNSAVGMEEFAALLSMDDEQFDLFSEMILIELNKALNDPNDKILLQQALEQSGFDLSDLPELEKNLYTSIEEAFGDTISDKKKDFLKRTISLIVNAFVDVSGIARKIVSIPIEIEDSAQAPTYAHDGDAAMDIYALGDYDIAPGETVMIRTGIKVAIPLGYALLIQPRSGQSKKTKLRIPNTPGLIDSGYRDEICVLMENIENPLKELGEVLSPNSTIAEVAQGNTYGQTYHIDNGQRIAQMRLVEVPTIDWVPVSDIHSIEGDRGGGFGSSGN